MPLFIHILTMAYCHGEMQINLFLSALLHCKNEQLEPYIKYSITVILNHYLRKHEILKIKDQFEYEITLFINKYKQNKLPSSFSYNHEIQNRLTTRLSHQLYIQRCDPTYARKLLLFEFPKIWSYCTNNYTFTSQSKLKRQLKGEMLSHYASSVMCVNTDCKDCLNWLNPFIWKSCDRPRQGHIYDCYKLAKKSHRKMCRESMTRQNISVFRKLNNDLSCGRFKQFWNLVRKCKSNTSTSQNDISIEKN